MSNTNGSVECIKSKACFREHICIFSENKPLIFLCVTLCKPSGRLTFNDAQLFAHLDESGNRFVEMFALVAGRKLYTDACRPFGTTG